ncbi:MAG: ComEA family DNA-binding protein [bacterium]|nr:ComEA family DNA-binding protein [bacterium]
MRSSPPERLAAWLLTALLLLSCGVWWWRQERAAVVSAQFRQEQERLLAELQGPEDPVEDSRPAVPPPAVTVHVAGSVRFPGVYELPEGSRVVHAVEAAGGAVAGGDPHSLELAALLVDGQTYRVYTTEELSTLATAASQPVPAAIPARVNINTAASGPLQTLPGIGPVKANAIIQYRRDHGPFASVEELLNVPGIGPATLDKIRHLITLR